MGGNVPDASQEVGEMSFNATTPATAVALSVCVALGLALAGSKGANAQSPARITVAVEGVRNDNGSVRCGLYSSPNGFREPGREMRGVAAPIKNGRATCVFNGLPNGQYAAAVFHAEHNETQMETGLFGKPKQGYGFSRNASSMFGPPSFGDAAFDYEGGHLNLPVQLSY
jgi:uncharacterized protein (DUF2141 family)